MVKWGCQVRGEGAEVPCLPSRGAGTRPNHWGDVRHWEREKRLLGVSPLSREQLDPNMPVQCTFAELSWERLECTGIFSPCTLASIHSIKQKRGHQRVI